MNIPIKAIVVLSIVMRIGFFLFGLYQDLYMTVKYTDIDYLVFSDASNYVYQGQSPYERETYRYTPLLAWMLVPNCFGGVWYHFGKFIFMFSDLITGFIIMNLLRLKTISNNKIAILSSIWLLNPMVITISTRGSSESVLTVIIMTFIYFLTKKSFQMSAFWLGLAIHFKIYPIIYLPSVLLYLCKFNQPIIKIPVLNLLNWGNITYLFTTLITLTVLNIMMYYIYGQEFLQNSYLYHITRLDHRHNFSVYNILLYYKSSIEESTFESTLGLFGNIEQYAFIPQLLLSMVILPLLFARRDLISTFFLQTFAFVTFNKVITSQYFIWFLIFLPHYLALSDLLKSQYKKGLIMLLLWLVTQGTWLFFAYKLEFLGQNTFDNGLLYAACGFFLSNCWILGCFIEDMDSFC